MRHWNGSERIGIGRRFAEQQMVGGTKNSPFQARSLLRRQQWTLGSASLGLGSASLGLGSASLGIGTAPLIATTFGMFFLEAWTFETRVHAQVFPSCPLGKCVQMSAGAATLSADMLPSGLALRVSMSSRGELAYTAGDAAGPEARWVNHVPRYGRPIGNHLIRPDAFAWDIGVAAIVGAANFGLSSSPHSATVWDLLSMSAVSLPIPFPQPLPSGGVDPSALLGISDNLGAVRVVGWASEDCSSSHGSGTHIRAFASWYPPLVTSSAQWLQQIDGDGCSLAEKSRLSSEARHVNLLGFPVGRLFDTPSASNPCAPSASTMTPYALPFVDAVEWNAMLPGVPGTATLLPRLQTPNGARAERISEMGVIAGWAGFTASGACGQSNPGTRWTHATLWNAPPLGTTTDLHALTLSPETSSVAASVEDILPPSLGVTVGGQRGDSTAVLWRQCDSWTVIDVADIILEAGDPSVSSPLAGSETFTVKRKRALGFEVVTDVLPTGLFAGFKGGMPFAVTRFEDLNSDLRVNADDLSILLGAFGIGPTSTATLWDTRDLDQDGDCDTQDVSVFLAAHSGKALAKFPDFCSCGWLSAEERMSFEEALLISGFGLIAQFDSWLSEALRTEPDLAEWQVSEIHDLMFIGGES